MKIHLVTAEHFSVPGLITKAFMQEADAMAEAAELVNIMLKDDGQDPDADSNQWGIHLELLQDTHGAAHCYVEINEVLVAGPDPIAALVLAESFIAGFEGDELQEGIDDLLATVRGAIEGTAVPKEAANPAPFDAMREFLIEALNDWPQFDVDQTALTTPGTVDDDEVSSHVSGGDLVEWFGEWRGRVKGLMAKVEGRS